MNIQSVMPLKCNILLVGKTGAGKSRFSDMLFGTEVFTSTAGMIPRYWENHLLKYSINISGVHVNVFKTYELEKIESETWIKQFYDFLDVSIENDAIYVVFYFVSGKDEQLEQNEILALTDIKKKYDIPVYEIIVNDILTEQGKVNTLKYLLEAFYKKVGKELLLTVNAEFTNCIRMTHNNIIKDISNTDISIFNISKYENSMNNIYKNFEKGIESILDVPIFIDYIAVCKDFLDYFNIELSCKKIINDSIETFNNLLKFEINDYNIYKKLNKMNDKLDNGSIPEQIGVVFESIGMILFMKSYIKKVFNEIFYEMLSKLEFNKIMIKRYDSDEHKKK